MFYHSQFSSMTDAMIKVIINVSLKLLMIHVFNDTCFDTENQSLRSNKTTTRNNDVNNTEV